MDDNRVPRLEVWPERGRLPIETGLGPATWGLGARSEDLWGGAEFFARSSEAFGAKSKVYVVEPQGALAVDPEALRLVLLLKEDPEMKDRHLAHIGDFLSRFTCKDAKLVEVLGLAEFDGSAC